MHISEGCARSKLTLRPWITKEGAKREGMAPVCQGPWAVIGIGMETAPASPVEENAKCSRTPSQQEIKLLCLCWLKALTHFSCARPNIEEKRRP